MFDFLYVIIGWIMKLCYSVSFNNYIITLFIFALVMQVILFPFGIKQQKSSVKLASIRPKEMAIRQKYKGRNDRVTQQKMQMEIQEMYKAENYSPTAGCLPLLVQMPIIFALFGVVRLPITYSTNVDDVQGLYVEAYHIAENQKEAYELWMENDPDVKKHCESMIDELEEMQNRIILKKEGDKSPIQFDELSMVKFMQKGVDTFMDDFGYENGVYTKLEALKAGDTDSELGKDKEYGVFKEGSFMDKLLYKENALVSADNEEVYDFNAFLEKKGIYTAEKQKEVENGSYSFPDFDFIGETTTLDTPSFSLNWLILVPILVFISSFLSSEITRRITTQPVSDPNQPNPNSGFMRWMMPAMSTYFAFTFPAAIGIYWVFRSIFAVGQQFILTKMYPAPKFTEDDMKKAVSEVKAAKKRKKLITIEVDEDDTSYDELAISEEKAEKIRRRKEKLEREAAEKASEAKKEEKASLVEKPVLKDDDSDRKE